MRKMSPTAPGIMRTVQNPPIQQSLNNPGNPNGDENHQLKIINPTINDKLAQTFLSLTACLLFSSIPETDCQKVLIRRKLYTSSQVVLGSVWGSSEEKKTSNSKG